MFTVQSQCTDGLHLSVPEDFVTCSRSQCVQKLRPVHVTPVATFEQLECGNRLIKHTVMCVLSWHIDHDYVTYDRSSLMKFLHLHRKCSSRILKRGSFSQNACHIHVNQLKKTSGGWIFTISFKDFFPKGRSLTPPPLDLPENIWPVSQILSWVPLRSSDFNFDQNWKPGTGDSPPKGLVHEWQALHTPLSLW
jgi:hypothetical protein